MCGSKKTMCCIIRVSIVIFQISEWSVLVDCGHFGGSNLLNLQRSWHCKRPKTLSRCRFHFIRKVLVNACVSVAGLELALHWCSAWTSGVSTSSALQSNLLCCLKVHKGGGAGPGCNWQALVIVTGLTEIQIIIITSEIGEFANYSNGYLHFPSSCSKKLRHRSCPFTLLLEGTR